MKISRKLFSDGAKKALACGLSAAMVVAFAPTVAFGADYDSYTAKVTSPTTGKTNYYDTLAEAAGAAQVGDTLTLGKDVKVANPVANADKNKTVYAKTDLAGYETAQNDKIFEIAAGVNIDGAGHTISIEDVAPSLATGTTGNDVVDAPVAPATQLLSIKGETDKQYAVKNLTLVDKRAVVISPAQGASAVESLADLSIASVGANKMNKDDKTKVDAYGLTVSGVSVDDLTIVGTANAIVAQVNAVADDVTAGTAVEITGGTYDEVSGAGLVSAGTIASAKSIANISGGTFAGDSKTLNAINNQDNSVYTYVKVTKYAVSDSTITGGTFNGYVSGSTITGGTFAADPTKSVSTSNPTKQDDVIADEFAANNVKVGYAAFKAGSTYTVKRGVKTNAITGITGKVELASASKDAISATSTQWLTDIASAKSGEVSAIDGLTLKGITDKSTTADKLQAVTNLQTAVKEAASLGVAVTGAAADVTTDVSKGMGKAYADYIAANKDLISSYNATDKSIVAAVAPTTFAANLQADDAAVAGIAAMDCESTITLGTDAKGADAVKKSIADNAYFLLTYNESTKAFEEAPLTVNTKTDQKSGATTYSLTLATKTSGTYAVIVKSAKAIAAVEQAEALSKIAEALGLKADATVEEILKAAEGVSEGTDAIKEILGEAYDEEKTLAENIAAVAEAAKAEQEATDAAAIKAAIEAAGLTYDESKSIAENVEAAIAAAIKNQADVDAEALKKALENAATEADKAQQEAVENAVKAAEEKAATEQEKALEEAAIAAKAEQEKAVAEAKAAAATAAANVKAAASKQLAKVKNKTVKAKAKKATGKTAKKKAVKLASTTGVTYAKAYTSYKKVTISKKGKVTVKKGAKKGTYKMVVVATCGDYAKTVTVTVKVK